MHNWEWLNKSHFNLYFNIFEWTQAALVQSCHRVSCWPYLDPLLPNNTVLEKSSTASSCKYLICSKTSTIATSPYNANQQKYFVASYVTAMHFHFYELLIWCVYITGAYWSCPVCDLKWIFLLGILKFSVYYKYNPLVDLSCFLDASILMETSWESTCNQIVKSASCFKIFLYIVLKPERHLLFVFYVLHGAAYMMPGKRFTKSNYHAADITEICICNSHVRQVLFGIWYAFRVQICVHLVNSENFSRGLEWSSHHELN